MYSDCLLQFSDVQSLIELDFVTKNTFPKQTKWVKVITIQWPTIYSLCSVTSSAEWGQCEMLSSILDSYLGRSTHEILF